jgi:PA domain-containing protein
VSVSFRRSFLPFAAVLGLVLWTSAGAAAVPLTASGWDPVDGPAPVEAEPHPGGPGHLPPGSRNMALVGKVQLTNVDGGIADVAAFGNYAYLNAFSPECAGRPGAQGTGVHVVNISNPAAPAKVAFIPAHANSYVGEGIHVVRANTPSFSGDILIHNNETCNATAFAPSGASLWNVTNPNSPTPLSLNFGDTDPAVDLQTYHTTHSAQLFVQRGVLGGKDRVLAFLQDNQDLADVDIFDVSNPTAPVKLAERGLEDWPGAQGSYANGDTVFHHDMQGKRIAGHDYLLVSYWDAGQVLLNIDNPANPTFVTDSDYRFPDPLMPQFDIPEGNSHQSYWDADNEFIISTDEDFSPYRTLFEMTSGANAGEYGAGEFGFTPTIDSRPDGTIGGPTVWGGRGCLAAGPNAGPDAVVGEPSPPPASAISAAPGEEKTVVFSRGGCFFSTKIAAGQDLGYDAVIIAQSHGGSRNGLLPDAFFCGGQGHDYDERVPAICIGHRAAHLMFNDTPEYTGADGPDIVIGTLGAKYVASTEFDGWGYVQLHDARDPNLRIIDSYAIPEALDESFTTEDHGILSVHEVKTDPRLKIDLAYISYYNAGARVVKFGPGGMTEVGHFIPEGGVHFWGTFPMMHGQGLKNLNNKGRGRHDEKRPLLLFSDRDSGLYILQYTGKE